MQSNLPGATPTGSVDFSLPNPDGSGATIDLGSTPVAGTSNPGTGKASLTVPVSALGATGATASLAIKASYVPDSDTYANAQGTTTLNVQNPVAVTLSAAANVNPATAGQAVRFTATVNPPAGDRNTATGTVTFQAASGPSAITKTVAINGSGEASWTTSSLASGNDVVNASYSGDGNYQSAQAPTITEQIQPQLVKPSLYVAEFGANAIGIYGTGATGRKLLGTISGSQTGLNEPDGVVLDSQGDLYVANAQANTITEYAPGASNNVAPIATIAGSRTALNDPRFLALDSSDDLFVVNGAGNSVAVYQPGTSGNTAPITTVTNGIDDPIGAASTRLASSPSPTPAITRSPRMSPIRSRSRWATRPRWPRCRAQPPAWADRRGCSSTASTSYWSPTTAAT